MFKRHLFFFICMSLCANAIDIDLPKGIPQAEFAGEQIRKATIGRIAPPVTMRLDSALPEQGYTISTSEGRLHVIGADGRGLMYGGLELAERIRLEQDVTDLSVTNKPFIKRRGLKMNIPLDARCPSYDDSGTSARMNVEQVWSRDFWHGFLDRMAEHRYNTLTLWCNHPFSAMLKLDKYPDVALNDVAVPTYELTVELLPQYMGKTLQNPANYTIIKKMSIEEKMAFWQHVMEYAAHRGIDIYFITWNIWIHGANGKYGINEEQTNEATIAYLRESTKQFILTYPHLKGLGITCGEHMQNKLEGEYGVEKWMWKTYGLGIMDAKALQPGRQVHFIHRIWYTGMDKMMDNFISKYPDPLAVGFKYARARLYSIPNPPFFKDQLQSELEHYKLSCWMNLRNDDIFNFRWGNPDYVRQYMQNLPSEPLLEGYHMGSDGYVWGREFTSKDPVTPRQLEIDKHWYKFMMWGRLGYDPTLDRSFFQAKLKERFPQTDPSAIYELWQIASRIVPLVNTYHWRDWDHMWSVETCMSRKEGYHSVNHFIEFGPLHNQGMQSITDFVKNPNPKLQGPTDIADQIDALSEDTLVRTAALRVKPGQRELKSTVADLEAFAHLGNYYADKIRGGLELHRYRVNGQGQNKQNAIDHLKDALDHWQQYAKVASAQYEVQMLARTSTTDWNGELMDLARQDIRIVEKAKQNEFSASLLP